MTGACCPWLGRSAYQRREAQVARRTAVDQTLRVTDAADLVWPFPILPKDLLSEKQLVRIEFLKRAYQEGFAPRVSTHFSCWMATSGRRIGDIVRRSSDKRDWWEVVLSETDRPWVASGFVFGFDRAAELVLRWLRGRRRRGDLDRALDHRHQTLAKQRVHRLGEPDSGG